MSGNREKGSKSSLNSESDISGALQELTRSAKISNYEGFCAVGLWIVCLPVMLYMTQHVTSTLTIVMVSLGALSLHSRTLRPFFRDTTEGSENHESTVVWGMENAADDTQVKINTRRPKTGREISEERKLIITCLSLAASLGSAVAFSNGGSLVFHSWTSASASDCSVADFPSLQEHSSTFFCNDGYVDLSQQLRVFRQSEKLQSSYNIYHMAPVFRTDSSGSGTDSRAIVALAVSKQAPISGDSCSKGLCGIFVNASDSRLSSQMHSNQSDDKTVYEELRQAMGRAIKSEGDVKVDAVPIVELTNPINPHGKMRHLIWGVVLYVVVLCALIGIQFDYMTEPKTRPPVAPETAYEALQAPQ